MVVVKVREEDVCDVLRIDPAFIEALVGRAADVEK